MAWRGHGERAGSWTHSLKGTHWSCGGACEDCPPGSGHPPGQAVSCWKIRPVGQSSEGGTQVGGRRGAIVVCWGVASLYDEERFELRPEAIEEPAGEKEHPAKGPKEQSQASGLYCSRNSRWADTTACFSQLRLQARTVPACLVPGEGRSWVRATCGCVLTWWSEPALQPPPLREGTNPTWGLTLMTSSHPCYLLKALPPDITLGIGASRWEFAGHTHWSVAARISPLAWFVNILLNSGLEPSIK